MRLEGWERRYGIWMGGEWVKWELLRDQRPVHAFFYSPVASIHVRLSMIILHLASEVSAHGVLGVVSVISVSSLN